LNGEKAIKIKILLLFLISFLYSSTQYFDIEFLGLNAAAVELNIIDTVYFQEDAKLIMFNAKSISLIDYIFNINNLYNTITTYDGKNILLFNKVTSQLNLKNTLNTSKISNNIIYDSTSTIIPKNTFNIFSLLYYITKNKLINTQIFNIEREGLLYKGTIKPILFSENNFITYELDLIINNNSNNIPIIKNTDIFTWAVFKKEAKRHITIDYNNEMIVKCIFRSGILKMTATNINYIKSNE